MYYTYVLENIYSEKWYIGFTSDLSKRLIEHNSGRGGKTTSQGKLWNLMYYEAYLNKQDATGRELFLKSGSGHKFLKRQLIHYLKKN